MPLWLFGDQTSHPCPLGIDQTHQIAFLQRSWRHMVRWRRRNRCKSAHSKCNTMHFIVPSAFTFRLPSRNHFALFRLTLRFCRSITKYDPSSFFSRFTWIIVNEILIFYVVLIACAQSVRSCHRSDHVTMNAILSSKCHCFSAIRSGPDVTWCIHVSRTGNQEGTWPDHPFSQRQQARSWGKACCHGKRITIKSGQSYWACKGESTHKGIAWRPTWEGQSKWDIAVAAVLVEEGIEAVGKSTKYDGSQFLSVDKFSTLLLLPSNPLHMADKRNPSLPEAVKY